MSVYHRPRGPWDRFIDRSNYEPYKRTYQAATDLRLYMFERWRNEAPLYALLCCPSLGSKFEVVLENA